MSDWFHIENMISKPLIEQITCITQEGKQKTKRPSHSVMSHHFFFVFPFTLILQMVVECSKLFSEQPFCSPQQLIDLRCVAVSRQEWQPLQNLLPTNQPINIMKIPIDLLLVGARGFSSTSANRFYNVLVNKPVCLVLKSTGYEFNPFLNLSYRLPKWLEWVKCCLVSSPGDWDVAVEARCLVVMMASATGVNWYRAKKPVPSNRSLDLKVTRKNGPSDSMLRSFSWPQYRGILRSTAM